MPLALVVVMLGTAFETAAAQRTDSTRAGVASPSINRAPDSSNRKLVSPRRAFLTSLLLPGTMQLRLGRPKAAGIFLLAEVATLGMTAKSWYDLDKAKSARNDTIVTAVLDDLGRPVVDTVTGLPRVTVEFRNPNLVGRIRARRTHLEDWVAATLFNHLFAGADAYVAANLQDFKANVQASSGDRGLQVMARVSW